MVATTNSQEKAENIENQWVAIVRELGPGFASQAAKHDAEGSFVAENYELMRQRKLFSAAVPEELGGGGAVHSNICAVIRELAHYDGSTALCFSICTLTCWLPWSGDTSAA